MALNPSVVALNFVAESPSDLVRVAVAVGPPTGMFASTIYEKAVAYSSQSSVSAKTIDSDDKSTWSPTPISTVYSYSTVYDQNIANVYSSSLIPDLMSTPHDGKSVRVKTSGTA